VIDSFTYVTSNNSHVQPIDVCYPQVSGVADFKMAGDVSYMRMAVRTMVTAKRVVDTVR
jgi:hypothetical protein